jgi:hypothetical protein
MNSIRPSLTLALMVAILVASLVAMPAAEVVTNATFTKITTGNIVSDHGNTYSGAWADYDNDGFIDLVAANGGPLQSENNFLYRNNADGTFTKATAINVVTNGGFSFAAAWGDYDNDGYLDLFILT